MIISHKHKFIFIKNRKTAGTSLEIALASICGKDDIFTENPKDVEIVKKKLGYQPAQNYFIPFKYYTKLDWALLFLKFHRNKFYHHISAELVKKYIHPDIWDSYYKFCFERNPWDKTISEYYWSGADKKYRSIFDFIKSGGMKRIKAFDMYTINKIVCVDKIYKFEDMDNALKDLTERFSLQEPLKMPKYKAYGNLRKDKRNYRDILSNKEVQLINTIFAREIALLDYRF